MTGAEVAIVVAPGVIVLGTSVDITVGAEVGFSGMGVPAFCAGTETVVSELHAANKRRAAKITIANIPIR